MARRRSALVALALVLGLCQVGTAKQPASSAKQQASPAQPPATQAAQPADQAAPPQQPIFRTGINFVRVDVIVTDGQRRPVTDLTQADFEVLEDGRPQSIEQFRLIRVDGNPRPGDPQPRQLRNVTDEELELSRDDVRVFVFFLDDYHVRRSNSLAMRDSLARFVENQLRPNDIVGVMYPLTPLDTIGFTRDHAAVAGALRRFEGRKYDYQPRNGLEEAYMRQRPSAEAVEQIRNQVVISALRGLATRLGGLREARKSVIMVSEGLTALLPPQMRSGDALLPATLGNPAARNPQTGENNPREETAGFFAQAEIYRRLRDVFNDANRNNTSIYTVDPRGLVGGEFDISENVGPRQDASSLRATQDTLRSLAEETDGRAIINQNDLAQGLAQIVQDSSFYYLIGYNSAQAPTDGRFHEIRVRVRRPNVDVRARRGYWAATLEDITRVATPAPTIPRPIQDALASIAPSVQSGKYVRTWVGTERGENGRTKVTLVWEPLPTQGSVRRDAAGRVAVLAADARGDLVFRGRSPEAPPAPAGAAGGGTAAVGGRRGGPSGPPDNGPHRIEFETAPGEIELRLTIEGADGVGTLDNEIRKIAVPDLTSPDAAISTPRVHRVRTAREAQTVIANGSAVPVASREFSRTERLLIRFDVYGNATPTAVLLNRGGARMNDIPVAATTTGGTHVIDLPLSAIATGEYLIEITAKGATNETKELIAFRIGS